MATTPTTTPTALEAAYVIQVTALEPTREANKAELEKKRQAGFETHVTQLEAAPTATWDASLLGCFASCVPNCCIVTWCPCVSLAHIETRMGESFEMALLGFGALFAGLYICIGCTMSALADKATDDDVESSANDSGDDAADGTKYYSPPHHTVSVTAALLTTSVLLLLITFLVARLRRRVRSQFELSGSLAQDLAVTLACGPCVIAQMATQLHTYTPGMCSLDQPHVDDDVLAAYPRQHI